MNRSLQLLFLALFTNISFGGQSALFQTQTQLFRPFSAEAHYHISHIFKGQCKTPSKLVTREGVWQCEAAHQKFDPCFSHETPKGTYMLCFETPFSNDAIGILLNQPLSVMTILPPDLSKTLPWGVILEDDTQCYRLNREFFTPNDEAYQCNNGLILLANIHRCHQPWSIVGKSQTMRQHVKIKKAVF